MLAMLPPPVLPPLDMPKRLLNRGMTDDNRSPPARENEFEDVVADAVAADSDVPFRAAETWMTAAFISENRLADRLNFVRATSREALLQ
jgi:hypothetical protein